MNLKDILNNTLAQSGFLERGSFTTASDPDSLQMVAIANRAAYEIRDYFKWTELRKQAEINIQPGQSRYQLPADFQDLVPNSAWEGDGERQVEWPVPDGRWFMYKFTSYSAGGTYRIRKYGDEIEVISDAEDSTAFSYEYISKWVVQDAQGARKESFTADDDEFILDDQVLVLGIQAHWAQTKLMPQYQEWYANYNRKMQEAIGRSSSGKTIGGFQRGIGRRSPYYPTWQK